MEEQALSEKVYRLGPAGRRMAYLLIAGCLLIWLFALWTLKNTLQIGLRPENFWPSLKLLAKRLVGYGGAQPLGPEEAIPALIMLVLAAVVPLLIWNIVAELRASYTVGPDGIAFRSLGVTLTYPWAEVAALNPVDEESAEPLHELIVRTSRLGEIRNGLVRFLHWQAHGRLKLPLYSGLEEREELLERIRAYMAAPAPAVAGGDEPSALSVEETEAVL